MKLKLSQTTKYELRMHVVRKQNFKLKKNNVELNIM